MGFDIKNVLSATELREMLQIAKDRGEVSVRFSYEIFKQFVELVEKCELIKECKIVKELVEECEPSKEKHNDKR